MLYVNAAFSILNCVEDTHADLISTLREITGEKMRRVDRYTLLALAGALQCGDRDKIPTDSMLVLATQTGTLSTSVDMMNKIAVDKMPPKPFQFVNSLGNSACYSLARRLNIQGPSLAISQEHFSFESGLDHAQLALTHTPTNALVGGLDEAPLPIQDHFRRHLDSNEGFKACYEGSHWLSVSRARENESFAGISLLGECSTLENFSTFIELSLIHI